MIGKGLYTSGCRSNANINLPVICQPFPHTQKTYHNNKQRNTKCNRWQFCEEFFNTTTCFCKNFWNDHENIKGKQI